MPISLRKTKSAKPLDPVMVGSKLVYPCVRTAVYTQVLRYPHLGITAVTISDKLQTDISIVKAHLKELCLNKHIFIKSGKGSIVRVDGFSQTFAKYVLYNRA